MCLHHTVEAFGVTVSSGKTLKAVGDEPSYAISPDFLFQVLSLSSVMPLFPLYAGSPIDFPYPFCKAYLGPSKLTWAN